MKKILLGLIVGVAILNACLAPIKPIPPIGCSYQNAMLVNNGGQCYWVYVNCG